MIFLTDDVNRIITSGKDTWSGPRSALAFRWEKSDPSMAANQTAEIKWVFSKMSD